MSHVKLHEDMQPIQLRGGELYSLPWFYFFTTITPFFSFTIHQHLFSNDTLLHFVSYAILACFINITKGLSCAHYDFQWVFTLLLKKREQKTKWMFLTQEPTFFVFMVVTQEPTIRNVSCYSCLSHILETFIIKRHHHVEPKFKMPNVLKETHAWLHEDMQQV